MHDDHSDGLDWLDGVIPPHRLVVESPPPGTRALTSFVPAPSTDPVRQEWTEYDTVITPDLSARLGMPAGTTMVQRTLRVHVADEPVLLSHSYLPPQLTDGDGPDWHRNQHLAVGQLALASHTTVDARPIYLEQYNRTATAAEATAMHMPDRRVHVLVHAQPHLVTIPNAGTVRAGVLIVARGDRVYVRVQRRSGRAAVAISDPSD
jgi:chorismate-pyruvate lyase